MPRRRINYVRDTYVFPEDFPQRLVRFKEESGLPWAEIARKEHTGRRDRALLSFGEIVEDTSLTPMTAAEA